MTRPAVVYVHGLWLTGAEGLLLRRRLERERGHQVHVFHYRSMRQPMSAIVAALADTVAALAAPQVHLLGHSLGGLVILEYLARYPMSQPGRVLFMGSPVMGSSAVRHVERWPGAKRLLGKAVCEQLVSPRARRWEFARELGVIAGTVSLGFARFFVRFGEQNDGVVAISETRIPGAKSHISLPVPHIGLLFSARAAREAGSFLEYGRFGF